MAKHSEHDAAGVPLRRAHAAAWFTFVFMAGTTMAFQTYHSVETGQMPWPLAVLYGIGAFVLAITVLHFARHSPSGWVRGGAYALTAGAMYLSASATGDVTRHAAPPHAELLFGLLMDGAALLAIHFIMNGPKAAHAVAEVDAKVAQLTAQAAAERSGRERAEASGRAAADDLRARAEAEIGKLRAARERDMGALREETTRALESVRGELSAEREARAADAAAAARSLDLALKAARTAPPKARARNARERDKATAQDDATTELRALMEFRSDPSLLGARMGAKLADKLGVHPSTGRRLHGRMVENGQLRPEYAAMAAPLAGDADARD